MPPAILRWRRHRSRCRWCARAGDGAPSRLCADGGRLFTDALRAWLWERAREARDGMTLTKAG